MDKNMSEVYRFARYAYTNVPLYMRIAEEIEIDVDELDDEELWNKIPCVNKSRFVHDETDCISIKYMAKLYQEKLYSTCTSGSTGMYMNIFWDKNDYNRSLSYLWLYRKKYYSVMPNDRLVYFYTMRNIRSAETEYEYGPYSMGISKLLLDSEHIKEVYMKIYEYSPVWALLQPSVAGMLCNAKQRYNLPDIVSLKYMEMTGEYLEEAIRKEVKEVFKCDVANQYGCNEANSIAYECPYGNMHCMTGNIHISIENRNIYLTTLQNYAMPFVKYGLGDNVVWDRTVNNCRCGCKSPVIKIKRGRESDYIKLKNREVLSSSHIHRIFDVINACTEGAVKQYKVIQKEYDVFEVMAAADDEYVIEYIKGVFCDMLNKSMGTDVKMIFEACDVIPPDETTGKLKSFECRV